MDPAQKLEQLARADVAHERSAAAPWAYRRHRHSTPRTDHLFAVRGQRPGDLHPGPNTSKCTTPALSRMRTCANWSRPASRSAYSAAADDAIQTDLRNIQILALAIVRLNPEAAAAGMAQGILERVDDARFQLAPAPAA